MDAFVAGVGTTGTFMGVARYLTERPGDLLRVAVEPQGSILAGGRSARTPSRGSASPSSPILDRGLIDEIVTITDAAAFETCRPWPARKGSSPAAPRAPRPRPSRSRGGSGRARPS